MAVYRPLALTLSLNITKKNGRGWSVEKVARWTGGWGADDTKPNYTYEGHGTLAGALWQSIPAGDCDRHTDEPMPVTVESITVKGKPMSNRDAYAIIEKDLAGSVLKYKLPDYRKALGV